MYNCYKFYIHLCFILHHFFFKLIYFFIENEEEFRPLNNFGRRGRGRRGGGGSGDMDRRNRGMPMKRRLIAGSGMKNKRSEDEEKVCQYFLQGKCLKVKFDYIYNNYEFCLFHC